MEAVLIAAAKKLVAEDAQEAVKEKDEVDENNMKEQKTGKYISTICVTRILK